MSGISSMPPISSLQRYLTDAHDSLQTRRNEPELDKKHLKVIHNSDEHREKDDLKKPS
jgi:hypothetical protein